MRKPTGLMAQTLVLALVPVLIAANGCIIVPTPAHGGFGVITKEAIESLEPGKTTRADVLLKFGDPAERLENDRFFVYEWVRIHGYIGVAWVGGAPLGNAHYLALEFTPENRLKRFKVFDPRLFRDARRHVQEWIEEKGGSPTELEPQ